MLKVFIGYDKREEDAVVVAKRSLESLATTPVCVTILDSDVLHSSGVLRRPVDRRGGIYDIHSNAPCATDFSNSRFVVPMLAHQGWALFIDCDVLFHSDIAEMLKLADPKYAVMVVKHQMRVENNLKMDGCVQTRYARKNWSSVMLFNCNHPANRRLTLQDVNERPGRDLHAFYWLHDSEIGELPMSWNWLVDVDPRPDDVNIAHYTLGTPDMVECGSREEAEWRQYLES